MCRWNNTSRRQDPIIHGTIYIEHPRNLATPFTNAARSGFAGKMVLEQMTVSWAEDLGVGVANVESMAEEIRLFLNGRVAKNAIVSSHYIRFIKKIRDSSC